MPRKLTVTEALAEMKQNVIDCDGIEVFKADWPLGDKLVAAGECEWIGDPRGPYLAWKRLGLAGSVQS